MDKSKLIVNEEARDNAVTKALTEYKKHVSKCKRDDLMIVIDYTEPSFRKRLHIVTLKDGKTLRSHHVAHGEGSSDPECRAYSNSFSNTPNSHKSSLGAMVTSNTYRGKHGYSLRLDGLEKGKNDNVRSRAIVMHSAGYCRDGYILTKGRCGQSWGCPAIDPAISNEVIGMVKGGCFLYAYYK